MLTRHNMVIIYTNIKSLCCTPETNKMSIILHVNYNLIFFNLIDPRPEANTEPLYRETSKH